MKANIPTPTTCSSSTSESSSSEDDSDSVECVGTSQGYQNKTGALANLTNAPFALIQYHLKVLSHLPRVWCANSQINTAFSPLQRRGMPKFN